MNEIDILKVCNHPTINKLIDVFEDADNFYLVLEYIDGKNLGGYVFKSALHEYQLQGLVQHIMHGMKYLHDIGIAHRDIKLENVMVDLSQ